MNKVLFSSNSEEWATPQDLFDKVNLEFNFTLDVCATHDNAKCPKYFTKKEDGLSQDWTGEICWMNPPYGRDIGKWTKKAKDSAAQGARVVALLPARTDTKWFHEHIYSNPWAHITFIKGRLKFGDSKNSAPFPSMLVDFYEPFL